MDIAEVEKWVVAYIAVVAPSLSLLLTFVDGPKVNKSEDFRKAMIACMNNDAYVGINQEDTRALFLQCLDDYKESR